MKHQVIGPLIAAITLAASLIAGENTGPTRNACEIYQNHAENDMSANVAYIFNPTPITTREVARYSIVGNAALRDSLKMGDRYCFTYTEPLIPWADFKLKSIRSASREGLESRAENTNSIEAR